MTTIEVNPAVVEAEGLASVPGRRSGRFRRAIGVLVLGTIAWVAGQMVWGVVLAQREDACKEHLRDIGRALLAYHGVHRHFPAPYTTDSGGRPLLSWRVAILPYFGRQDLYDRFDQSQPWDSPTNRALLAEMPDVFRCPQLGGSETPYRVYVGPESGMTSVNTPFEPGRGVDHREITDGTPNTILVAEAPTAVPWTRPAELAFNPAGPVPVRARRHREGSHVVLADGSTRWLKPTLMAAVYRALLTINGGEMTS